MLLRFESGSWWRERWGPSCVPGGGTWGQGPLRSRSRALPGMGRLGVRDAQTHPLSPLFSQCPQNPGRPARLGGPGFSPAFWAYPSSAVFGQTSGPGQRRNQSIRWACLRCCLMRPEHRLASLPHGCRPAILQATGHSRPSQGLCGRAGPEGGGLDTALNTLGCLGAGGQGGWDGVHQIGWQEGLCKERA